MALLTSNLLNSLSLSVEGLLQKDGSLISWDLWNLETTFGKKAGSVVRTTLSSRTLRKGALQDRDDISPTLRAEVIATKNTTLIVNHFSEQVSRGSKGSFIR
ncbi:hypothetical protein GDO81_024808 [Engystomops pustulosus]|uniref:Uncharacterized protein n=1 Tax=Engystomops pustulosus TaxID=76066 RepID=A0AAV6YNJ1_ENGPU|nr:hypothetical protein GDO81_024808 [Engystomops pustulosus]